MPGSDATSAREAQQLRARPGRGDKAPGCGDMAPGRRRRACTPLAGSWVLRASSRAWAGDWTSVATAFLSPGRQGEGKGRPVLCGLSSGRRPRRRRASEAWLHLASTRWEAACLLAVRDGAFAPRAPLTAAQQDQGASQAAQRPTEGGLQASQCLAPTAGGSASAGPRAQSSPRTSGSRALALWQQRPSQQDARCPGWGPRNSSPAGGQWPLSLSGLDSQE